MSVPELKDHVSVDRDQLTKIMAEADTYSVTLTDRALIKQMLVKILPKLPMLQEPEVRAVLKIALKRYHAKNEIAIEKIGLLGVEERLETLATLRSFFLDTFVQVFSRDSEGATRNFLNRILDLFFNHYQPAGMR